MKTGLNVLRLTQGQQALMLIEVWHASRTCFKDALEGQTAATEGLRVGFAEGPEQLALICVYSATVSQVPSAWGMSNER